MSDNMKKNTNNRNSPYGKGERTSSDFKWALDYDSNLKEWQINFKDFLSLQNKSYNLYRQGLNSFIDYLLFFPNTTREPKLYVSISYNIENSFNDYLIKIRGFGLKSQGLRNTLSKMNDFFEWYLINNCIDETSNAPIINSLEYFNPIEKISVKYNSVETMRNSLATRYLRMLEEILIENNCAWSKKFKNEWVEIDSKKVWNPVITYILLLKLKLPLRNYQLRYLDSGECDKSIFNYNEWKWEKNTSIQFNNNEKGVLRRIIDKNTQKEFVGLYINTNKTNDVNKDIKGYVIPWENKEVIKIIFDLIEWQKKYNPVTKPLKWINIDDLDLKKKSKQQLEDLGENTFLFRDMFNNNPQEPIKDIRIQNYWRRLLAELEQRVNSQIKDDRNKVLFIEKWNSNNPIKAYYDLHSLRVTNLTALYQSGVPYPILSKYIAGHSSIIMTMYYTKYNVSHITEVLNQATKEIEQKEQINFNEFIANKNYENIKDEIVFNNQSSIEALSQLNKSNYMTSDIGICPVGENKCNEGGELLPGSTTSNKIYAPVENGPKNCLRCRFFITGVPFLLGLTTKFNELSILIKEKVEIYKQSEIDYEELYLQRYKCEENNIAFTKWKELEIADSNYNKQNNELDQILKDWQQLYNLIEQCIIIKEEEQKLKHEKLSLVTIGNIEEINNSIIECSEFELYDSVCQSSVFYKSIEPNIANIKRGKIINKMLMNNNIKPYFLLLDDKESLYIGNEFIKLLMLKLGKPNAINVMNEKKKLSEFGLSSEIEEGIQKLLNNKYEFNGKLLIKVNNEKSN